MVISSIKVGESLKYSIVIGRIFRLGKIWKRMRSERQKVDQVNSSLLEYKNFFQMSFGSLSPGNEAVRYIRGEMK